MRTHKVCKREPFFDVIEKEWNYYDNAYKGDEERKVVDKISGDVRDSLNYKTKIPTYVGVIKKINF